MALPGTIATIGEAALVERIRQCAGSPPEWLHVGIGDDAAVYAPDRSALQVITTDDLVEGVHFDARWSGWRAAGAKAVAVNLSDLAAMGAAPRGILLGLVLPRSFPISDFDALVEGVVEMAGGARASLIGGNLSTSPGPVVVNLTAFGAVGPRKTLTRSGGRPDDELYVTGRLGAAAAGLRMFQSGPIDRGALDDAARECLARYERPDARVRHGVVVGRSRSASAAVDLSDGLGAGVRLIAEASGTGAIVDAALVPIHPGATRWAGETPGNALQLAIDGGEDYELLFAVHPRRRRSFLAAVAHAGRLPVTKIGRLTSEPGCWLEQGDHKSPLAAGYDHFRSS